MTSRWRPDDLSTIDLVCAAFHASGSIEGYVYDAADVNRHWVVEVLLDGWPYQVRRADLVDLRSPLSPKHGRHGFCFTLPSPCAARYAEVRLANAGTILAGPLDLASEPATVASALAPGRVQWEGGLVVGGFVDGDEAGATVRGFVDGALVFEVPADGWTHVAQGDRRRPVPAFEAHLPSAFADGRVHWVDVATSAGETLAGSPLQILAFAEGLGPHLAGDPTLASDGLRGRLYDTLAPRSVPFAWFGEWAARFPIQEASAPANAPVAIVVCGESGLDATIASLESTATAWTLGVLPCDGSLRFDAADLRDFLEQEAAGCTAVVVVAGGTRFHPSACMCLARALDDTAGLAFADVVAAQAAGSPLPLASGSFDLERALEQGAGTALFAMPRDVALSAAREGASTLFDLFFHAIDAASEATPVHVPGFLAACPPLAGPNATDALAEAADAHLRRHGVQAVVKRASGVVMPATHIMRTSAAERVAVLLPVRNDAEGLRQSVEPIRTIRSRHGIDLHIVDMGSSDAATLRFLKSLTGHHQHVHGSAETWNVARAMNGVIREVRSRYVLFLECGSRFEEADWLDELIGRCLEPDVAAAGPLVVTGNVVAAAGLVGGPEFGFAAAFAGAAADASGYADFLRVARSCVALPLAGLLTKRSELQAVGGFDADRFGRHLHSVDFGLKVAGRRKRMVFTPHVRLSLPHVPYAWAAGPAHPELPGLASERDALRDLWGNAILDDPFYSPALTLARRPFSGLAWPPRGGSLHSSLETPRSAASEG